MPNLTWVHSLQDYRSMFNLDEQGLQGKILDYPARISSFNAELYAIGVENVVSVDAKYDLAPFDMIKQVDYVIQRLAEDVDQALNRLAGEGEPRAENLLNVWNQYAQLFLSDYSDGVGTGRYRCFRGGELPFANHEFDLALCPDLIAVIPSSSILQQVTEIVRVAKEVRIFPLLNSQGEVAEKLGPVMLALQQENLGLEVCQVPYKFHEKSNAMLRIWAKECEVN